MPIYYDSARTTTTNATAGTLSTHFRIVTIANQDAMRIMGIRANARLLTAGGDQLRISDCSVTAATGGTAQTPRGKDLRISAGLAAQTTVFNDATAITPGGTLNLRESIGFAATGGQGGWQPQENAAGFQMQPNATNPLDMEIQSIAANVSVPIDLNFDIAEGA